MARVHGADCRVYLGERDASADISQIAPEFTAQTHEATTFNSGNYVESDPGLIGWEASFDAFYQPQAGGIGRQVESIGGTIAATTIVDGDANAIGDSAVVFGPSILTKVSSPKAVADLMKIAATLKGTGKAGAFGKLLHVLGQETITGTSTSVQDGPGGSTANGSRANLHVTAVTGSWTMKVQHSPNDSVWADLITFTQATAAGGVTSESKTTDGTVDEYVRASFTEDVAGSVTFAMAFSRY